MLRPEESGAMQGEARQLNQRDSASLAKTSITESTPVIADMKNARNVHASVVIGPQKS